MRYVVLLVCVVATASLLYVALQAWLGERARRNRRWRVETVTRADGTLAVVLQRDGSEHERVVRELPAGLDSLELTSELRLAHQDARLQADELNRSA